MALALYYDSRDEPTSARSPQNVRWLRELGAQPISAAGANSEGFLFAGARVIEDYRGLVSRSPRIGDTPEQRAPLLRLDTVLDSIEAARIDIPMPHTWRISIDARLPDDLSFPLFVRTAVSSWKLGGRISKVKNRKQLEEESGALRRAFGWDQLILARQWLDLAKAGESMYGPVPREIRVWIIDCVPFAWSFHYLNVVPEPDGFPPAARELESLVTIAHKVGRAFASRCVVADFARTTSGEWIFIEAGPGSCAGTAHEEVFKAVARKLGGDEPTKFSDKTGGVFAH